MWGRHNRTLSFYLLGIVVVGSAVLIGGIETGSTLLNPPPLHTLSNLHTASASIVLILGVLALIQYAYQQRRLLIFIGCAYLAFFALSLGLFASNLPATAADNSHQFFWINWVARSALAGILCLACLGKVRWTWQHPMNRVYVAGFVLSVILIAYNAPALSKLTHASVLIPHPEAFFPGLLFLFTAVYMLRRKRWQSTVLDYTLVLALLINAGSDILLNAFSVSINSPAFLLATGFALLSHTLLLVGLLVQQIQQQQLAKSKHQHIATESLRQHNILTNLADGIFTLNDNHRIESINPAMSNMFGYREQDILGKHISLFICEPFDDMLSSQAQTQNWQRYSTNLLGVSEEIFGTHADGSRFPVSISTSVMYTNNIASITGTVRDISARRMAEQLVIESEKRFRGLFDVAPIGILMLELNDDVLDLVGANKAASQMFDTDLTSKLGTDFSLSCPEFLNDKIKMVFKKIAAKVTTTTQNTQIKTEFYENKKQARVYEAYGYQTSLNKIVVMLTDVTERLHAQKMHDEFVATISQELSTPLTAIRSSLGFVASGTMGDIPEKIKNFIDVAHNNSERLLCLINDIIDISNIQSGEAYFNFENNNLNNIIQTAVDNNAERATQFSIALNKTNAKDNPDIFSDPKRITQLLTQLISNAINFSSHGSKVNVGLFDTNTFTRIYVTDKGCGIPDAFKQKVFNKFAQADTLNANHVGGTGLGLNICKAICKRHRGQINFVSLEEHGSCFYLDIPKHTRHQEGNAVSLMETYNVLLLDNDPVSHYTQSVALTELGFTITAVANCQRIKDELRLKHYSAVVVNINSIEVSEAASLNKLSTLAQANFPIIIIGSDESDRTIAESTDANPCLHQLKAPISNHALNNLIRAKNTATSAIKIRKRG